MRLGLQRTIMYELALAFELAVKSLNGGYGHDIAKLWGKVPQETVDQVDQAVQTMIVNHLESVDGWSMNVLAFEDYLSVHPALFDVVGNRYEEDHKANFKGFSPDLSMMFGPHTGVFQVNKYYGHHEPLDGESINIGDPAKQIDDGWPIVLTYWRCIVERALVDLPEEFKRDAETAKFGVWELWRLGDGMIYRNGNESVHQKSVFGHFQGN